MDEPKLVLWSDGLLSKWGFGDGDEPDAWLDWCDEQGIDYNARGWDWHTIELTPDHVEIPYSEVLRIARQVELSNA
jgi:hypothetical protein